MFAAELLLGGNPITGAVGGLACCAMMGTAIYAMRKKIPHPSEFAIIGCCCLRGGCHQHEKFNLIVEVHEAANIPKGSPVYLYVECGRFDAQSAENPVDSKTHEAGILERLNIHVRQMDNVLTVSLWRKGAITGTLLGELDIDVVKDIIEKNYPQLEWYHLKKDDKLTVKVKLSFHRLATDLKSGASPLVEYALIHATREAQAQGKPAASVNFDAMNDKEKLRFLSRVLEGPLRVMGGTGWKEFYFKAVEGSRERWRWLYWQNKEAMLRGDKPKASIPLLAISLVLPDNHNRHQFYVKYYNKSGAVDIFFSRVDRDRNLWSDGLYEFLERLRAYLDANPPISDAETFSAKQRLLDPGREKVVLQPGVRTLISPTQREKLKATGTPAVKPSEPKYRQPMSISAMIEEAMEGYDLDDEEEETSLTEDENQQSTPPDEDAETAVSPEHEDTRTRRDTYVDDSTDNHSPAQQTFPRDSAITREGSTGGPI